MIDVILVLWYALQAAAPAPAPVVPQEGERPTLSVSDLKALRESNIFAPHATKTPPRRGPRTERETRIEAPPAKPKPPLVTGVFFDPKSQAHQAVVEDRNEEKLRQFSGPKFLKAGDEFGGFKVEAVADGSVTLLKGDASKVLHVGDALPEGDFKGASTVAEGAELKTLEPAVRTETLEGLKRRNKKNRPSQDE